MRVKVSYRLDPVTVASLKGSSVLTGIPMTWIVEEAVLNKTLSLIKAQKNRNPLLKAMARFIEKRIGKILTETQAKMAARHHEHGGRC